MGKAEEQKKMKKVNLRDIAREGTRRTEEGEP